MLNIAEELKEIYRTDNIPLRKQASKKTLDLYFPAIDKHIRTDQTVQGSFELTESICNEQELTFGGCISSTFKIEVADFPEDITGMRFTVVQTVNGKYEMPLGTYEVYSAKRTDDLRFKEIEAYDLTYNAFQKDVVSWYNSLSYPLSLKAFRESFFDYLNIPIEKQHFVNDDMPVEKTIVASTLTAREVAKAIGEINGTFGFMRRNGRFTYLTVAPRGLYPAETLFPAENLYPSEAYEYLTSSSYINTKYEEYEVREIDSLKICMEEGDVGAVVSDGTYDNPYIMIGNFLVYGKNHEQLSEIARNVFDMIKDIGYQPQQTTMLGLPYLEPGDTIGIIKRKDSIESYIFTRTLTGEQILRDKIEARGSETRGNDVAPNQEIQILKGKSFVLKKTVEGLDIKITDVEANAMAKIEATATEIRGEVSTLDNSLRSLIRITATEIRSEVSNEVDGLNSKISQTATEIRSEVSNEVSGLNSKISQTATDIRTEIRNEVSGLNSTISQTTTQIRTEIKNEVDGLNSTISQTATSINTRITNEVSGLSSSISQTTTQIRTEIKNEVDGLNSTISQTSTSINTRITNEVAGLSSSISQTATSIRSEIKNEVKGLNSTISQTATDIRSEIKNEVSGLNSTISQTASSISTRITNEVTGLSSSISQTESSLTSQISDVSGNVNTLTRDVGKVEDRITSAEGNVNTLTRDVNSLSSRISGVEDEYTQIYQDVRNISFDVYNDNGIVSQLRLDVNGILAKGVVTFEDLSQKNDKTVINGSNITTGKLTGVAAEFTETDGAYWRGMIGNSERWVCNTEGLYCEYGRNVTFRVYADSGVVECNQLRVDTITPNEESYIEIPNVLKLTEGGSHRDASLSCYGIWGETAYFDDWCYAPDWTSGSDRRIKEDINYDDKERLASVIDVLKPVTYRMRNDKNKKMRFGFIAQDIKKEMDNLYPNEMPLYGYFEEDDLYTLSYDDIIAPLVAKVQRLEERLKKLEDIKNVG